MPLSRARAAARLGRWRQALDLTKDLAADDRKQRDFYVGFAGLLAAWTGDRSLALEREQQLADERRPFTFGEPQFQAGRIAAALGDLQRAEALLTLALRHGYPYGIEFHRDRSLGPLRGRPIMNQLDLSERSSAQPGRPPLAQRQ